MSSRVLLAILAASLGWGLAGVGTRALFIDGASTMTVVTLRTALATAAVAAYAVSRRLDVDRTAWRHGSLIGSIRIGIAPILFIASLNYISAGFESLVITLIPVVTAGLAHLLLGERLEVRQAAGLALGLAGTAILVLSGESGIADGSGNTLVGGGLALGGVLFGSLSGVLSRRYAPYHETTTLAVPMFVSGAVVVALATTILGGFAPAQLDGDGWAIIVGLGLGSTLLPFVATLYASRHTTAARVALTGYLAPLVGVVGGVVLLGELVTAPLVIGGALTLAGVVVAGKARQPAPAAA